MRTSEIIRKTGETDIYLSIDLDGSGKSEIDTGCGFLDHMLTLFASHGSFDLKVTCNGDSHVDYHHSVEDIGICLGKAFKEALGDKKGIARYADIILPMDETLMLCAVDISGRSYLNYSLNIPTPKVGEFDTELCEEFMISFVRNSDVTLHFKQLFGSNSHHIIEAAFKSLGRVMKAAVAITGTAIPSTKGVL
ncbi:MAG: imidazoleglycerol-phosphate dehydratase HisB [Clostridia bacterium]|nr:imidazoleglycerol-phosphate dehydratase HisB [Clostridia bacterium]